MAAPVEAARRTPFASREFAMRVASAIVLGAIVLSALAAGGAAFALVWLAAGIVGAAEWIAMSRAGPGRPLLVATAAALSAMALAFQAAAPAWAVCGLLALGCAALIAIARDGASRRDAVLGLLCATIVTLVPTALRNDPNLGLVAVAWMFAVVWSTDIVAYFTGRIVGGPKLLPRVSPKKTWSGAAGGLVAGALAGVAIIAMARTQETLAITAVASALASALSQAGDLFESALKRRYGVKDSGRSIPGHGGVMDRLDGFFAVAALAGLYLVARPLIAP